MTISSSSNKAQFNGSGSTGPFPFTFKVFAQGDLDVIKTDPSGVETTLTLTSNYTVSLNADQNNNPGGSVTTTTAVASGYKLTIVRVVDFLQETDITNGGGFYPEVMENALDRLTMLAQQNAEGLARAISVPITSSMTPPDYLAQIEASASAASSSASAASGSASAASSSASLAQDWAIKTSGTVNGSEYSAKKYALDSASWYAALTQFSGSVVGGNLTFTGTGNRITGDFSNATIANRVIFQTSTVNGNTNIEVLPNGTATRSDMVLNNAADPTNASIAQMFISNSEMRLISNIRGTGTYLPMTTYVGGFKNTEQPIAGGFQVTAAAGLGYGTGAGGTVPQGSASGKATPVTLNKPTGQITMNNAALAAGATVSFILSNSLVTTADVLVVNQISHATDNYIVWARPFVAGQVAIAIKNNSAGSLSDAVVINFAIIKGATS